VRHTAFSNPHAHPMHTMRKQPTFPLSTDSYARRPLCAPAASPLSDRPPPQRELPPSPAPVRAKMMDPQDNPFLAGLLLKPDPPPEFHPRSKGLSPPG